MELNTKRDFKLPITVVTQSDVSRLLYDLEKIEEFFLQVKVRKSGETLSLPRTSPGMDEILQVNNLNLLQEVDRQRLKFILMTIRTKSPVIHLSFSAVPNQKFLEKIVGWLRINISEIMILQIGLQPSIGAGFVMRTNNKFFDFSLRQHLNKRTDILIKELRKGVDP